MTKITQKEKNNPELPENSTQKEKKHRGRPPGSGKRTPEPWDTRDPSLRDRPGGAVPLLGKPRDLAILQLTESGEAELGEALWVMVDVLNDIRKELRSIRDIMRR